MSIDPISAVASLAESVISRIWGNKDDINKQQFTLEFTRDLRESEYATKLLDNDNKQIDTNTAQAQNASLFVSGPRPFIMWGLGGLLVLHFLLSTGLSFAVALHYPVMTMPPMDPLMRDLILGLLGLGYLTRSYDKRSAKK